MSITNAQTLRVSRAATECLQPLYEPVKLRAYLRDIIYFSGSQLAVLLQLSHPDIAEAISKHSSFARHPMARFEITERYINTILYGSPAERVRIISRLHHSHSGVKGAKYSADNPDLQKWVAATLFVSFVTVQESFFGKLPTPVLEGLLKEYAIFATAIGMPASLWPDSLAEFWEFWDSKIANMPVTARAASVARDVLYPKSIPLWLRVVLPIFRIWTTYWLPTRHRLLYCLKDTRTKRCLYSASTICVTWLYPLIPRYIREIRHHSYMQTKTKGV
jgi:uncharacterized protein (DUF2236 family)